MAKEKISAKAGKRRVNFFIEAQKASNVSLMGDFNDWNEKKHPMKKENSEVWKKTIFLNPGRYEYMFLVDGQWQKDPNNGQLCENNFGTHNNYIIIQ
ncbi:MAG: glycogen-binding domain-containing protein [Proteobacteria bacterium]|nr:glycogen-binding domain-containing protein [Pseudomonadota bacterium]